MNLFDITSILLTASALGSFVNYKWIKLPSSIGLLLLAMLFGLLGIFLKKVGLISYSIDQFLSNINFQEIVFHGMLSFLLFAGALQINIEDLKKTKDSHRNHCNSQYIDINRINWICLLHFSSLVRI